MISSNTTAQRWWAEVDSLDMAEFVVPVWLKRVTRSMNYDSGTDNKGWRYAIYTGNQDLVGLHTKCSTTVVAWSLF